MGKLRAAECTSTHNSALQSETSCDDNSLGISRGLREHEEEAGKSPHHDEVKVQTNRKNFSPAEGGQKLDALQRTEPALVAVR